MTRTSGRLRQKSWKLQQQERQSRRTKQNEKALEAQTVMTTTSSGHGTPTRGKQALKRNMEPKSCIREEKSKIIQTKTGRVKLKVRLYLL